MTDRVREAKNAENKEKTEMVRIGLVGIGFMGMIHYLAAQRIRGGQVAAICSRDPKKLAGDWTSIQGNFGPRGTMMDLSGLSLYSKHEELFADPSIDLVDLCVPNDEHARLAIQALEAGKDVLVEKPIALSLDDADRMTAAARLNGRLLMVAHILPFFPEFGFAAEAVRSERFGALRAAHFNRIIAKPDWSSGIGDLARSGGPAIDLHIHDTHYIDLICGTPAGVSSTGVMEQGAALHVATTYHYPNGPAVSAISGALSQNARTFAHGFELYLEKAAITYQLSAVSDGAQILPFTIVHADGQVDHPQLGSGDPIDSFAEEIQMAAQAVVDRQEPAMLSGDRAMRALQMCLAEVESARLGQRIAL